MSLTKKNLISGFLAQLTLVTVLVFFLALIYIISFRFFHPETVYYFGIGTILIGAILLSAVFFLFFGAKKEFFQKLFIQTRDFFPCLLAAVFLMYSFHITIPTLVDRSISIYLLNLLDTEGGPVSINNLQDKFLAGYVGGYSVVCRRMFEQVQSGNVTHQASTYTLTARGKRTVAFLRAFATITGVNPYYVNSDDASLLPYRYAVTRDGCRAVEVKIQK